MIPTTDKVVMRPAWARRQRRVAGEELAPPTEAEIRDAIAVLADVTNEIFAPELVLEAERIHVEASV